MAAPRRGAAEIDGQPSVVLAPREHVDLEALRQRDLRGQVSGSAEAVDAQPAARRDAGQLQRPVADDAGAQQGRGLLVLQLIRQRVDERGIRHAVVGIPTVHVPARERRIEAQVLLSPAAEPAGSVSPAEPRDADALTASQSGHVTADGIDDPHDLVTRHDPMPPWGKVALREMEIRAADAADGHRDANLIGGRLGDVSFDADHGVGGDGAGVVDDPRAHVISVARGERGCGGKAATR